MQPATLSQNVSKAIDGSRSDTAISMLTTRTEADSVL